MEGWESTFLFFLTRISHQICISLFSFPLPQLQMLNIPNVQRDRSILSDLLEAFQPISISDCFFQGMQLIPSPGDIGYLYAGAYSFIGNIFDAGMLLMNLFFLFTYFFHLPLKNMLSLPLDFFPCSMCCLICFGFRSIVKLGISDCVYPDDPR